jgi:hypothetical protein
MKIHQDKQRSLRLLAGLFTAAAFGISATTASAGLFATPVANASFETPNIANFGAFNSGSGWALELNNSATNFIQDESALVTGNVPQTPYGVQWGGVTGLGSIYQQVGTWDANTSYTVSMLTGDRQNKTWAGLQVELWVGGTALGEGVDAFILSGSTLTSQGATMIGSFSLLDPSVSGIQTGGASPFNWTMEQSGALSTGNAYTAGDALWLRLSGTSGNQAHQSFFDNVSIVAVPEPSTLALLGVFGATLAMVRRKK